ESWIRKLWLSFGYCRQGMSNLKSWIDDVTTRRIQHLDVGYVNSGNITLSIYTCETLVHLRLCWLRLPSPEFVSLPCLKIMHLENVTSPNETTLQKLISGSPVLEDLKLIRCSYQMAVQVRSHTLKRIYIDETTEIVIDAPLLQCLWTEMFLTKNYQIVNSGFPAKLDIDLRSMHLYPRPNEGVIRDILTDISRVRDLVISRNTWKEIFKDPSMHHEEKREPNVMF
ncbi:unnamed protein product, partial [Arabidopsis halleri]